MVNRDRGGVAGRTAAACLARDARFRLLALGRELQALARTTGAAVIYLMHHPDRVIAARNEHAPRSFVANPTAVAAT